jgi:hypothetical protein
VRTSSAQANPAVAMTDTGNVIVVWSSYFASSGRSNEIVARRFALTAGLPEEEEFQINAISEGNQCEPDVATTGRGGFVVVWQGPGLDEEDIFARWFDPNGVPVGDEQLVNSSTAGRQVCPRVAAGETGACVVWERRGDPNSGERSLVCAQRFDSNGVPQGEALVVDDDTYDCRYPDVAMDARGWFTVVWLQNRTNKTVFAQCFDADGISLAEPFAVSQTSCCSITRPAIAMNRNGCFVVTWDGDPNRAGEDDIHARCYDPTGTPCGPQFRVNVLQTGAQQHPRASINDANEFVIVWEHETGDPNAVTDVFARRFHGAADPIATPFRINADTFGKQQSAAPALAADGSFVAVWEDAEPNDFDYDVIARIIGPPLAADFDGDGSVTLFDFATFGCQWREQAPGTSVDLNQDGSVDARDLAAFTRQWLKGEILRP